MVTMFEPWTCKVCGYGMDSAAPVEFEAKGDKPPKDGDVSFCLMCGEAYVLDGNRFRSFTDDELIDMPLDKKKHLSSITLGIRDFHRKRQEDE